MTRLRIIGLVIALVLLSGLPQVAQPRTGLFRRQRCKQFVIKRKALMMIKKAFDENDVTIANGTVQVSVYKDDSASAAREAVRIRKKLAAEALTAK